MVALVTCDDVRLHDMATLDITVRRSESAVVLHVAGPVDSRTAAQLQEPLLRAAEAPSGGVAVDLAEVPYLSSAGLRALLLAAKALQKRGERLKLLNIPPPIQNLLTLSGFTTFIDIG